MKLRIISSISLGIVYLVTISLYNAFQGSWKAAEAVNQLDDNAFSYGFAKLIVMNDFLINATHLTVWGAIACIWIPVIKQFIKKETKE